MKNKILLSMFFVIFGLAVIGCSKDNVAPPKQPKNTSAAASSSTEANTGNQTSSHTCGSQHGNDGN